MVHRPPRALIRRLRMSSSILIMALAVIPQGSLLTLGARSSTRMSRGYSSLSVRPAGIDIIANMAADRASAPISWKPPRSAGHLQSASPYSGRSSRDAGNNSCCCCC